MLASGIRFWMVARWHITTPTRIVSWQGMVECLVWLHQVLGVQKRQWIPRKSKSIACRLTRNFLKFHMVVIFRKFFILFRGAQSFSHSNRGNLDGEREVFQKFNDWWTLLAFIQRKFKRDWSPCMMPSTPVVAQHAHLLWHLKSGTRQFKRQAPVDIEVFAKMNLQKMTPTKLQKHTKRKSWKGFFYLNWSHALCFASLIIPSCMRN